MTESLFKPFRTTLLLLVIALLLTACSSDPGLTGSWQTSIKGTTTTMTLKQDGRQLNGNIVIGRSRLIVRGEVKDRTGTGKIYDAAGKSVDFTLIDNQASITMTLIYRHPATGQILRQAALVFTRVKTGAPAAVPAASARRPAAPPATTGLNRPTISRAPPRPVRRRSSAPIQRDPRLVGNWLYSKTFTSGTYSSTTERHLRIFANGTYQYGAGRFMATMGGSSGMSNRGNVQTGRWRTANGVIYIYETGGRGWEPYARYYIEGNSMMMTFSNGSRRLWTRN